MKYIATALTGLALIGMSATAQAQYRYSGDSVLISQLPSDSTISDELAPPMPAAPSLDEPGLSQPAMESQPRSLDLGSGPPAMPVPDSSLSAPAASASQPTHDQAVPTASGIPQPIVQGSVTHEGHVQQGNVVHVHNGHNHSGHNHSGHVRYYRVKKKQNVFEKIWDMEKKKNAWLKRTFLGS